MALLHLEQVSKSFDGLQAVDRVDFAVEKGEIKGLIGPNGAGKTTLFNVITGLLRADEGEVSLDGIEITSAPIHKRVKMGLARTFQTVQVFPDMTVLENVRVGTHRTSSVGILGTILGTPRFERGESEANEDAMDSLEFVGLDKSGSELARNLPYGHQRLVEIARALVADPTVLLLDEPSAGMNRSEAAELMRLIGKIRDRGITVVIIEHNMKMVMDICDSISVLDHGQRICDGEPHYVQSHPQVCEAYLGKRRTQ
jgi:ABC-type branched-subunit amino acid transport system ATPase component